MKSYTTIALGLIFFSIANSQEYKYGDVTKELLNLSECTQDTNADAMVTTWTGKRSLVLYKGIGFKSILNEKKQIKIFNNEAKDIGTVRIFYYSPKKSKAISKITEVKGKTYNIMDGNIIHTKIAKENIFEEQYNSYYKVLTIAIPSISKNCVFEYEYELISDYATNIDDWIIQETYPVLYNEFQFSFPEFYNYQVNIVGGIAPTKTESNITTKEFLIREKSDMEVTSLNMINTKYIFKNIEAAIPEPFVANPKDNLSKINFQLISIQFPNGPKEIIAGDYSKITKNLLEIESFGGILKNGKYIEEAVSLNREDDQMSLVNTIYEFFQKNIKWNGVYNYTADKKLKALIKDGNGDAADINLNYIAALNHAGIYTVPVILSTRGNGTLHPVFADYSHFDYVIAMSKIDGNDVFSDATTNLPFGNIPLRCLNGNGWIVNDVAQAWVDLKKGSVGKEIDQNDIFVQDDKIIYKCNKVRRGQFAFKDFDELDEMNENVNLKLIQNHEGLILDSVIVIDKKINSIKYQYQYHAEKDDDINYIKPILQEDFNSNPFTQDKRLNVVDFPHAVEYKFVSTVTIPEGYTYEAPTNAVVNLSEDNITFKYLSNFNASSKKLSIIAEVKILKTEYLIEEYDDLKNMFQTIIDKLKEPLVIKKI